MTASYTPKSSGQTRERFNREYVYSVPEDSADTPDEVRPGTWRLNVTDEEQEPGEGGPGGELNIEVVIDPTETVPITIGTPVYMNENGQARAASAASIDTAQVIGLVRQAAAPGEQTFVTRNSAIAIFNAQNVTEDGTSNWVSGAVYYLSTGRGKVSRTPPANAGEVVIEVLQAVNLSEVFIEISSPLVL